ncbi:MAG: hypothetical protein H6650_17590 [Ardenticatenales bacterium]|nr:hypothetical protein [Ardenticatenales bacterium]
MPNNFVPIETVEGSVIWVEVAAIDRSGQFTLTAGPGERALRGFSETVDALNQSAQYMLETLKRLSPSEIEVEFGVTIGVEGGTPFFGLAKASGEASYVIKMKWTNPDLKRGDEAEQT